MTVMAGGELCEMRKQGRVFTTEDTENTEEEGRVVTELVEVTGGRYEVRKREEFSPR
jgi:hypothetical protein